MKYNPKFIVMGYDNKFGKNALGTFEYLKNNKLYKHIEFIQEKKYHIKNNNVKTSIIKKMIATNQIYTANEMLGYKYYLIGTVIEGNKNGRKLGFPTANIKILYSEQLIPSNGVYSVTLYYNNNKYSSICNIGINPTFNKNDNKRNARCWFGCFKY